MTSLSAKESSQTAAASAKLAALPSEPLPRLLAVMAALRDPHGGCPWDLKQNFRSLTKYTLEEAYEVVDAAERQDFPHLCEELGDLLLQVVFYAQLAQEARHFDFTAIMSGLTEKLIRRHPHVFGDEVIATAEAMTERWEQDKQQERAAKREAAAPAQRESVLDGITSRLPALAHSLKLIQRSTRVGFDWDKPEDVFPKLQEEIAELHNELPAGDSARQSDELGDVLFTVVCLANKLKIDPESALRGANQKFERRFRAMESRLAPKIRPNSPLPLSEWESAWQAVKGEE